MIDQQAIAAAIESLKMMRELMLFDPSTGEDIRVESLNKDNKELYDAAHTALACMRECAERREGCVFCGEKRHHIREAFDDGTAQIIEAMNNYALSIETPRDVTTSSVFPIDFCPMCGRKLERGDT